MNLINITLTEEEQEFLLVRGDRDPGMIWDDIVSKVRRAQDDSMFLLDKEE